MKAKRIVVSLLTALLCFVSVFFSACDFGDILENTTDNIVYQLSKDKTYAVVTGYEKANTEIVIAGTYKGKPVKEIDQGAFLGNTTLTKITIPENITYIGDCAFYGCSNLTTLILPISVTYIGDSAFSNCDNLKIYYWGTQTDFTNIFMKNNNAELQNAPHYYHSETPIANGWHYRWNGDIEIWEYIVGGVPFYYDSPEGTSLVDLYNTYKALGYIKPFPHFKSTYFSGEYHIENMYIGFLKSWTFDVVFIDTGERRTLTLPGQLIYFPLTYEGTGFISVLGINEKQQVYARLNNGMEFEIAELNDILSVAINTDGLVLMYLSNGQGIIVGRIPHRQELN